MKRILVVIGLLLMTSALAQALPSAAADIPSEVTLFKNVNIFDGKSEKLLMGYDVLVVENKIKKIDKDIKISSTYEIDVKTGGLKEVSGGGAYDLQSYANKVVVVYEPEKMVKKEVKVNIIDGKGRTLMPGLTDVHWHVMFNSPSIPTLMAADMGYLTLLGAKSAEEDLMRGFTTVRDVGGNPFGIKKAIDQGLIPGPRIYPSGPMISQTSGHSDNRGPNEPDVPIYLEKIHQLAVADGVSNVMIAVRQNLRMGATQIKISAGGGVSSNYDPLDVRQYTFDEMKAAVDVAKAWNTYVAIHANTDDAIQMSLNAGVLSVEHGFLMSEATVKLMAEKGAWFSMEPMLNDEDAIQFPAGSDNQRKWVQVTDGTDKVINLAKKYKVKTAFGSDILFDAAMGKKHGKLLAKLKRWYTPYEALKMATYDNVQLIKLCGPRDPYPGELGVVKEGALADLILVDGNPLENLDLVADPAKNFVVIMKDGKIYKNTVK